MSPLVYAQCRLLGEGPETAFTLEGAFTTVDSYMGHQVAPLRKLRRAKAALVALLYRVDSHVLHESQLLRERLATEVTPVGLLASVDLPVVVQVLLVGKGSETVVTLVLNQIRVDLPVAQQLPVRNERLIAHVTPVRGSSCMAVPCCKLNAGTYHYGFEVTLRNRI